MDIEEQPYDDRHNVPPARDQLGRTFQLSIPDAIDAVREFRSQSRLMSSRAAEAMRVVTDELEARYNDEQAPVPMPKHDANYTLDKAIVDTERAVRLNHLGHYTGMVSLVLGALQDRSAAEQAPQSEDVEPVTYSAKQGGLTYVDALGRFVLTDLAQGRWINNMNADRFSLVDLRILAAHLTTAIDLVTAELELRRK